MSIITELGSALKKAKKSRFPRDDLSSFAIRIGVSRATLQKMEKGDLSVSINSYYKAAKILGTEKTFDELFKLKRNLFNE